MHKEWEDWPQADRIKLVQQEICSCMALLYFHSSLGTQTIVSITCIQLEQLVVCSCKKKAKKKKKETLEAFEWDMNPKLWHHYQCIVRGLNPLSHPSLHFVRLSFHNCWSCAHTLKLQWSSTGFEDKMPRIAKAQNLVYISQVHRLMLKIYRICDWGSLIYTNCRQLTTFIALPS